MKILRHLFQSSLGKKYLMAGSGLVLFGFVAGHMIGNLQIFLGPEVLNRYAHFLQSLGELLWVIRFALLGLLGLHIWSAVMLTIENRRARPLAYESGGAYGASVASRTMIYTGLIIAAFVGYHLLHFTVRAPVDLTPENLATMKTTLEGKEVHDVYRMVVVGFQQPLVASFYILAVSLLSFHLGHGVAAMFQSLGLKNRAWDPAIKRFGTVASWALAIGYVSIPAAVWLRLIK
jgi:succinate dehydrogenase / fumarate reductase cytochrome b subunit